MSKLEPVAEVGSTYTLLWAGSETISAIHERSGVKVGSLLVTTEQAEAHCAELRQALHDLVQDLEMRSKWKEGSSHGVVDCGNGVYMQAKAALGEL